MTLVTAPDLVRAAQELLRATREDIDVDLNLAITLAEQLLAHLGQPERPVPAAMDWRPYLEADPARCDGVPCIKGTRISVDRVLEMLAAGASAYQIELDFPGLGAEDVRACIAYAREKAR